MRCHNETLQGPAEASSCAEVLSVGTFFFFLLSMHSGKQESSLRSSPTVNPIQALRVLGSGGVEMSGRIGSYSVLLFWVAQQQNPEIEMLHSHRFAEGGHPEGRNLTNKGGALPEAPLTVSTCPISRG